MSTKTDSYIKIPNIFSIEETHHQFKWEKLMDGVLISRLNQDPNGSSSALLKLETGVKIPEHLHTGYEYVLLLSGEQRANCSESGAETHSKKGELVIAKPGSKHEIQNIRGGYVLIIWEKPVKFDF